MCLVHGVHIGPWCSYNATVSFIEVVLSRSIRKKRAFETYANNKGTDQSDQVLFLFAYSFIKDGMLYRPIPKTQISWASIRAYIGALTFDYAPNIIFPCRGQILINRLTVGNNGIIPFWPH